MLVGVNGFFAKCESGTTPRFHWACLCNHTCVMPFCSTRTNDSRASRLPDITDLLRFLHNPVPFILKIERTVYPVPVVWHPAWLDLLCAAWLLTYECKWKCDRLLTCTDISISMSSFLMPIHRFWPSTALAMLARSTSWKLPSSCGEKTRRAEHLVWDKTGQIQSSGSVTNILTPSLTEWKP